MSYARLILLVMFSLTIGTTTHAQVCAKGHHAAKFKANTADLHDYNCSAEGPSNGLRVSFFRASELVAGALLMNEPIPDLDRIIGPINFVDNDVYREAKALFTNFGSSRTYESAGAVEWELKVSAGSGPQQQSAAPHTPPAGPTGAATPVKAWYLTKLFGSITSDGVLLKSPSEVILNTPNWPPGYQMNYQCGAKEKSFITCTTIWKYIGPPDFDAIMADVRAARKRAETGNTDKDLIRDSMSAFEKNVALFRFLDGRKLPDDFLFITNQAKAGNACEATNWIFGVSARPLVLDLAVIENLTEKPIRIDDFIGSVTGGESFRSAAEPAASSGAPGSLGLPPTTIEPGKRIALALRIVFSHDTPFKTNDEVEPPDDTFKKILARPAKSVFQERLGGFNASKTVGKVRESFLAPKTPQSSDYAYGAEINLSAIGVSGTKLTLQGREFNEVQTGGFPAGDPLDLGINMIFAVPAKKGECCPVLYSWRDDAQTWVYGGKILHLANEKEHKMTDRMAYPLLRTKFQIAEEEPEMAFIDRARLNLKLRDGRSLQLLPLQPDSLVIRAYTKHDVNFELPDGIAAGDVLTSEIEIVGYYRRYSALFSAANDSDAGSSREH